MEGKIGKTGVLSAIVINPQSEKTWLLSPSRYDQVCLPFTWKTRNVQLENQMVGVVPFGVLLKLWASGQSDALLLLLLGFTADVHTFFMLSIFC